MRTIMVMYDTLCRHFLEPYGNDWVRTPNFTRLAQHSVTFEQNYACSLPCMPARRDLHNGRINFLQRDWGPLEPYDDSVPEILRFNGVFSYLVSDHKHYWEDGGATYHTRYSGWVGNRGQEGDACFGGTEVVQKTAEIGKGLADPLKAHELSRLQDQVNRRLRTKEEQMPQAMTFAAGLEFLEENKNNQNWFLQIETFDPHEPFFTQPQWKELYPEIAEYMGPETDWPTYVPVKDSETPEDIAHVRRLYAAIMSMCDSYLGRVLDFMDAHDMWKDTLLIVNTDHGFLLGEHDWWGKSMMPAYEEISHTPLFIYDPVSKKQGERRSAVTSAIDLAPTILEFFGLPIPADMQGVSLMPLIRENRPVRSACLFGFHGCHVAVADGHHVYFRAPQAEQEHNCYEYTLMPTRMLSRFSVEDLQKAEFVGPLSNTKGCKVLKTPGHGQFISSVNFGTKLYDVQRDPHQRELIEDDVLEAQMAQLLVDELKKADAPEEQYVRLGLPKDETVTAEIIRSTRAADEAYDTPDLLPDTSWSKAARNVWRTLARMLPKEAQGAFADALAKVCTDHGALPVSCDDIAAAVRQIMPCDRGSQVLYFMYMAARTE